MYGVVFTSFGFLVANAVGLAWAASANQDTRVQNALSAPLWAQDTPWSGSIGWAEQKLTDCRESSADRFPSPCTRFVSEALERVYAVTDFKKGTSYLTGYRVQTILNGVDSGWTMIGTALEQSALNEAQKIANDGNPVVAVLQAASNGHVALVLPGSVKRSLTWQRRVPNAASFFSNQPGRSFIAKSLSYAFDPSSAEKVNLYYRQVALKGSATAAAGNTVEAAPVIAMRVATEIGPEAAPETTLETAPAEVRAEGSGAQPAEPTQMARVNPKRFGLTGDEPLQEFMSGTWCEVGERARRREIRAIQIDGFEKVLSWGLVDADYPSAFRPLVTRSILEMTKDGEIIGVTFAKGSSKTASLTAFFIVNNPDKLFETHIFDNSSNEITDKGATWARCH